MGMTLEEYESSDLMAENEFLRKQLAEALKHRRMFEADYENRLKADMVAMLEVIKLRIDNLPEPLNRDRVNYCIQEKINELKQESTTKTDKVDCKHTDCNNCVNHKYCDYEPTTKNDLGVEKIVDVLGSYTDLDIPYKREIAENILTKLSSVTPQPRWISTSERLPKEDGEYYATVYDTDENYKYMDIAELEDGIWQYKDYIKVLAWMPLPAPYEPQESEDV